MGRAGGSRTTTLRRHLRWSTLTSASCFLFKVDSTHHCTSRENHAQRMHAVEAHRPEFRAMTEEAPRHLPFDRGAQSLRASRRARSRHPERDLGVARAGCLATKPSQAIRCDAFVIASDPLLKPMSVCNRPRIPWRHPALSPHPTQRLSGRSTEGIFRSRGDAIDRLAKP